MNLLSLPDAGGMLVLIAILAWLRRRYHDESVDTWLLALFCILLETVAALVLHGSQYFHRTLHVIALDAYLVAAIAFAWAGRRDLLLDVEHLALFCLPAVPLFCLATAYGLEIHSSYLYIVVASASSGLGGLYILFFMRKGMRYRALLMGLHLCLWIPILFLAIHGEIHWLVSWELASVYMLVACSFRRLVRRDGIGGLVIVSSFVIWAACFLIHPMAQRNTFHDMLVDQVWNTQKFLVIIGMLLVLLENQTRKREREAMHDSLTGLPNRRLFDDRLALALQRSLRSGLSTAVLTIDLNNFKQINDGHGHHVGDLVLQRAAQSLLKGMRSSDTVARCGGDEFIVVVNDLAHRDDCEKIVECLHRALERVELPLDIPFFLDGSIGYAVFPEDAADASELRQLADIRMYKQKRSGSAGMTKSDAGVAVYRKS